MEVNPVPDPDALDSPIALTELERRSPSMATEERTTTEPTRTRSRKKRGWTRAQLVGAAAALALIAAVEYVEEFLAQSEVYPLGG